jgi:YbbR domain-containing protein
MRLPAWIRYDIGLKVAALVLALFLWVIIAERREVEVTADLPLKYTEMPTDLIFAAEVPNTAKARIKGKGKFLRWRLDNVYFSINLSAAAEGIVTHVVSEGEAEIPSDRDIEVLEVLEPKAIRLDLDKLVTRELPVAIRFRGGIPDDKVMIGKARSDPAVVVVDGGDKLVGPLDSVVTAQVDLGQLAKKDRVEALIDLGGLPYVSGDIEKVYVSARVEDRKELGIPSVPIEAPVGPGEKALFTPDSLDVVISGAESQVDSLDPQDLSLEIDARDLPKGQLVFTPRPRNGRLYFEVRSAGKPEEDQVFEVRGTLLAPYEFDLISVEPSEIGFVKR